MAMRTMPGGLTSEPCKRPRSLSAQRISVEPSYIMMQSSSSSDEDYMEFDDSSSSRKGGYLADRRGPNYFRYRTRLRMQNFDEIDSTASVHSRQTSALPKVVGTDPITRLSGFESQHSIPQTTPLTIRTSSLKVHRPMPAHSSSSIHSFADENRSHQVVTLQTPLLSAEDRSSSERSNQWSSSDLSSIRSYSVISVPVTSHDKTRPYQGSIFGTSFSSSATGGVGHVDEFQSSRFPSPAGRIGEPGENFQSRNETFGTSHPSPSTGLIASVDTAEELHKLRLQLYVFVLRCIAYPFTVALPQDPVRRYLKVTREYLGVLRERFTAFLNRDLQIVCDEAFFNAVRHFDEIYLRNEFVERAVIAGGFSMNDIRGVFARSIEQRLQRFEEIDGLPKQTVIGAWKVKFDQICRGGEGPCPIANRLGSPQLELTNPTKEQLYDLFMRILFIKKYEHQILYNACQLDSIDEQAAQVRRELADRKGVLEEMATNRRYPKMVHKEMEVQYVEEQIANLNQLMLQLDTVPVGKSHGYAAGPGSAVGVVVQLQRRLKKCSGHAQTARNLPSTVGVQGPQGGGLEGRRGGAAGLSPGRYTSIIGWTANEGQQQQQHQQPLIDGTNVQLLSSINHVGGNVSKLSIQLSFSLEERSQMLLRCIYSAQILICQLRPLRHLSGSKQLFCTIEVEGCPERQRTAFVKAAKPIWDTLAEFETPHPLPCVKIKLMKESTSPLSLDHKELGRIVLLPNSSTSHLPTWYRLRSTKRCNDVIEMQVAVRQERPSNLKHCGFCWVQGRSTFKKWKIRYICLIQVSQYTFIMAAFKEAKSVAYESMVLDGYTVDYCETNQELVSAAKAELATEPGGLSSSMPTLNKVKGTGRFSSAFGGASGPKNSSAAMVPTSREVASLQGSAESGGSVGGGGALDGLLFSHRLPRFFFNLVREGDALTFGVFEESELHAWVQAIHRATGQSHKPVLTTHVISKTHYRKGDCDGAHHLGVSALVAVKPHKADHLPLLKELLVRMLDYRLKDPFVSLGWLSPSQSLVLDEYCNRYSIRECQRYLIFLNELLNFGEQNLMIDIDLIFHSYILCADHVQGKTHEKGISTVLNAEMDEFQRVRTRLLAFLEKQLTGFRFHFPFNRPDGGLEKLLLLLDRVIAYSTEGIAATEAVRSMVRVCLRNAAVLNYEKISEFAQQEAKKNENPSDAGLHTHEKRLHDLLRLAEICIDTLQQNDDYFAKSFIWYGDLFVEHSENFLSLFQMDMTDVLDNLPSDNWGVFQIFQFLNSCLLNSETLSNGPFHTALLDRFAPIVESYLNLMETSITKLMISGIEKESWIPMPDGGTRNVESSSDLNVRSSVSSQTHPDTDNESYPSLNVRQNRSLRQTPTGDGAEEPDSSSPPVHNGLYPSSARQVRVSKTSTVGPTGAFLDVLSHSRPLTSVSHVMNPGTSTQSSAVNMSRQSIMLITPIPKTSATGDGDIAANGERLEHFDLAAELTCARCCRTVGTLIFRLYALKDFIAELGWPERVKAACWAEKTRKMCSSLLREAAKRTLIELDSHLRQSSKSTEFIVPLECLTMINTITAIRMQLFSLCHRHEPEVAGDAQQGNRLDSPGDVSISQPSSVRMYTETEAFLEGVHRQMRVILTDHLAFVLSTVLIRLARYDEGNIISSILTLAKPVDEDGRNYTHFMCSNLQILCQNLVDDVYLLSIFENWYTNQLRLIHEWLIQRRNNVLHPYQIKCLATIVRKVFSEFELQGVATHVLENTMYKSVCHRLQVEEATLSVSSSTHDKSPSSAQPSIADGRQNLIRAIGDGLSTLAQGAGLRHRQMHKFSTSTIHRNDSSLGPLGHQLVVIFFTYWLLCTGLYVDANVHAS
ncbi:Calcium-dependent secretion activator [Taenia solium]|eukprot:TsM_000286900 transcript=TsM_000286900 gene=TsM_000286900